MHYTQDGLVSELDEAGSKENHHGGIRGSQLSQPYKIAHSSFIASVGNVDI